MTRDEFFWFVLGWVLGFLTFCALRMLSSEAVV
jgi:hypothetical protein